MFTTKKANIIDTRFAVMVCVMVLTLLSALPSRADVGIIEIYEDITCELPEWGTAFEEAEIDSKALLYFLEKRIIPYYKKADTIGENRLYLKFRNCDECGNDGNEVKITAKVNCRKYMIAESLLNNPEEKNTTYVTKIDNIVVFLIDETSESSPLIRPIKKRYIPNPEYWVPRMDKKEEAGTWYLYVTKDYVEFKKFEEGATSIFENWNNEDDVDNDYIRIPEDVNRKKVFSFSNVFLKYIPRRKFSIFRKTPICLPDSIKINRLYHGK